jgi:hypothetical protein
MALLSRRSALTGAVAALSVGCTAPNVSASTVSADAFSPDPIFAAIERTREAWGALCAAATAADNAQLAHGFDSLAYEQADAINGEVSNRYSIVLDEALAVVPTTLPGVVAYLEFINDVAAFRDVAIESWQQEVILGALKAAVLRYVDLPASTAPVAKAVPVTRELLENYDAWLLLEHRRLNRELGNNGTVRVNIPGSDYHWRDDSPSPSTRAARVLSAVGCPLAWEA